jgi:hypothetical protein
MLREHRQHAERAVDKGGDYVDDRTQGKYGGQVDKGQERMRQELRDQDRGPDQPPR